MKSIVQFIMNFLFHHRLRYDNMCECIKFTYVMKRIVLSMSEVMIDDNANDTSACVSDSETFKCIDYGLIFSASQRIKKYIITEHNVIIVLDEHETIDPCGL